MQVCENYVLSFKAKKCALCSLLISKYLSSVQRHGCVFPCTRRKWSVTLPYSCDSPRSEQVMTDGTLVLEFTCFLKSHVLAGGHGIVYSLHFTPKFSFCWFILEQIKTITMCVCIHYQYLEKNSAISCSFSTPASHHSLAQPSPPQGSTVHAEEEHCVGTGKCSGVTLGGRQQLSQKHCGSAGLGIVSKGTVERHFFCFWLLSGGSAALIRTICFYSLPFVDFRLVFLAMQYKYSQALSFPCPTAFFSSETMQKLNLNLIDSI